MKNPNDPLHQLLKRMPQSHRQHLLHLTCRKCGTDAYAASPEIATSFGRWTRLRRLPNGDYRGLCMDCRVSQATPHKRSKL